MSSSGGGTKNELPDDRGIKFGTGIAYEDVYGADHGEEEYVSELPTPDEEHDAGGNIVSAREMQEELDEGRVSSHPSTLASSKRLVSSQNTPPGNQRKNSSQSTCSIKNFLTKHLLCNSMFLIKIAGRRYSEWGRQRSAFQWKRRLWACQYSDCRSRE